MAIETYTVPSDRVIHETKVDFTQRNVQKTLHIVQYDKSLPIIAVHLYKDGFTYTLPQFADMKIRWGKRDHTFVYKNVLGCDSTRHIVYFDVDEQMTYFNGPCNPILELIISGNKAGSSSIPFEIDRNPIQNSDIESQSEYPELEKAIEKAEEAAEKAESAEAWAVGNIDGEPVQPEAPQYHNNSKYYAENALNYFNHSKEVVMVDETPTDNTKLIIDTEAYDAVDVPTMDEDFIPLKNKVNEMEEQIERLQEQIERLQEQIERL